MTILHSKNAKLGFGMAILMGSVPFAQAFTITENSDAFALSEQLFLSESGLTVTSASLDFGIPFQDIPLDIPGLDIPDLDVPLDLPIIDPLNFAPPGSGVPQTGFYTNGQGTYGLPGPGIVLSTGNVLDYETGPNLSEENETVFGNMANPEQEGLLQPLTGGTEHFDPVQLDITFDVDSTVSTVSFFASFGSEEFPEFVNGGVNDGFGMFLNGENIAGALPTGAAPGDPLLPINIDNPDMAPIPGTELDGVLAPNGSPILRFDVPVTPNSTANTFTLLLADTGDAFVDTTIYLSSFGNFDANNGASEFTPLLPDASNPPSAGGGFVFDLPEVQAFQTIWIDPDVAVGYNYVATDGGLFATFTAPTLASVNDTDGYSLTFEDASGSLLTFFIGAGDTFNFLDYVSGGITQFELNGIATDLSIDPTDPLAFVAGVSFANAGKFDVTQTPITQFVPDASVSEPTVLALLTLSVAGLFGFRRKRQA